MVLPFLNVLNDPVGNVGYSAFADIYAIGLFYLLRDIRGGHSTAIHADDGFLQFIAHTLTLGYELRFNLTVTIPGNVQDRITQ